MAVGDVIPHSDVEIHNNDRAAFAPLSPTREAIKQRSSNPFMDAMAQLMGKQPSLRSVSPPSSIIAPTPEVDATRIELWQRFLACIRAIGNPKVIPKLFYPKTVTT